MYISHNHGIDDSFYRKLLSQFIFALQILMALKKMKGKNRMFLHEQQQFITKQLA